MCVKLRLYFSMNAIHITETFISFIILATNFISTVNIVEHVLGKTKNFLTCCQMTPSKLLRSRRFCKPKLYFVRSDRHKLVHAVAYIISTSKVSFSQKSVYAILHRISSSYCPLNNSIQALNFIILVQTLSHIVTPFFSLLR